VTVEPDEQGFTLRGTASGAPIDADKHELGAEVKAVTLYRLQVVQTAEGWKATVILNV
jgi:SHS2 domain-containing protein